MIVKMNNFKPNIFCILANFDRPVIRFNSTPLQSATAEIRRWKKEERKRRNHRLKLQCPHLQRRAAIIINVIMLWCCHHDHSHCESSPSSFDECRLSAGWPPTLRQSQRTWAASLPISRPNYYRPHPPSPFCYYYSARKLILILPSHGGWKAEST